MIDQPRGELIESIKALLPDGASVYVTQLTKEGYRNQIWQGRGLTFPHDLIVYVDKSGMRTHVSEQARLRLNPPNPNGFEAVVIFEGSEDDVHIYEVIEYQQSEIGETLQQLIGKDQTFPIVKVPDPTHATNESAASDFDNDDEVLSHLMEALNIVLEGPPGTGKTTEALRIVDKLSSGDRSQTQLVNVLGGRRIEELKAEDVLKLPVVWEIVQLHSSYSYEDFIQGLRTDPLSEGFNLAVVDGILPQIARVAQLRGDKPTVLILDEVNRCNISAVFGEAIFAIDPAHRGKPVRLQYNSAGGYGNELRVPPNLYIIGTMNSADRSIALLDFAVRRRFRFVQVLPSTSVIRQFYQLHPNKGNVAELIYEQVRLAVANPELVPGPSYYLQDVSEGYGAWLEGFVSKIVYELRPLLQEYHHDGLLSAEPRIEIGPNLYKILEKDDENAFRLLHEMLEAFINED